MAKVRLTVTESRCRSQSCKAGDSYLVDLACPPLCMELWHAAYPYVFALLNGAALDSGETKARSFTVRCPDEGRVCLVGELVEE